MSMSMLSQVPVSTVRGKAKAHNPIVLGFWLFSSSFRVTIYNIELQLQLQLQQ